MALILGFFFCPIFSKFGYIHASQFVISWCWLLAGFLEVITAWYDWQVLVEEEKERAIEQSSVAHVQDVFGWRKIEKKMLFDDVYTKVCVMAGPSR